MAYRFANGTWVKQGILDNTIEGKVAGQIEFAHIGAVRLDLQGNMLGEMEGKKLKFQNPNFDPHLIYQHGDSGITSTSAGYFEDFDPLQLGFAGKIFLDNHFYMEWYSESNWRCVIELPREACKIL